MLDITPIPAFTDNYIWGISDGQRGWLVDPGDAAPALNWLKQRQLTLAGILITHHHSDHIGGISELVKNHPNLVIYGPSTPKITAITHPVAEGDTVQLGQWQLKVLDVPAHTLDHIAYHLQADTSQAGALFCGDALFAAGCGRLFEGTAEQLNQVMNKLKALAPDTLVCCAHEYTLANLQFAKAVEPQSAELEQRYQQESCKRQTGLPTLPSTIGLERATNPFFRPDSPELRKSVTAYAGKPINQEADIIGTLRRWKDNF